MLAKALRLTALTALALAFALAACGDPGWSAPDTRTPATVSMAERLADLAEEVEARNHPYAMSRAGAGGTNAPPDAEDPFEVRAREVRAALRDGRAQAAMNSLQSMFDDVAASGVQLTPALGLAIVETAALAHLRLWTESNCLHGARPGASACSIPLPDSVAAAVEATNALAIYGSIQDGRPDNLAVRWLLNLSAMMAGSWPEAVPEDLRIPALAPGQTDTFPAFPDVAPALGVDVEGHAGGGVLEDLDRDGDLDLAVSSWHLTDQLRIFRNDGPDGFTDVTEAAGLTGITGGLHMVQADYDNDGWTDLLVLRGAWTSYGEPSSLLRNRGDFTFEDVTERAGLLEESPGQVGVWADVDSDGWLDLFVGHESMDERRVPSRLYRNDGDGTFTDVAAAAGVDVVGFVKGAAWGDIDDDGRPDLYVSRLNEPNLLFRNEGPGPDGTVRFTDVTSRAGVGEPLASFPAWFWDHDNDGRLDIFVSGYRGSLADIAAEYLGDPHGAETPRLYRNAGDGTFTDVTREAGLDRVLLTMGSNFGDLDNDGWLDFHVGTGEADLQMIVPDRMFRNDGGRVFRDVTFEGGFGHLAKGHGVAFGDIDGDGDQDVHVTLGGAYPADVARNALYLNPGWERSWITLTLEGVTSNRSAIGARIRMVTTDPDGEEREIHRVVGTGSSFGANSLAAEIGLGTASAVRLIEIRWPAGGVQRFEDVEFDRHYRVIENEEGLRAISAPAPPEGR